MVRLFNLNLLSLILEWFDELSTKFLKVPASKFLILAGTDRLDKDLMIAHMQGEEMI